MEAIATSAADCKPQDNPEMLLSAIRCAILRAKLDANEFTTIGIALRDGSITPDQAIEWLGESGLISQVIPDANEQRAA